MKLIDTGDHGEWNFERFPSILQMGPRVRLHYAVSFHGLNKKEERFNTCTMALSPSSMENKGFAHGFN